MDGRWREKSCWFTCTVCGLICDSDAASEGRLNGIVSTGEGVVAAEWCCAVFWVSGVCDKMAF